MIHAKQSGDRNKVAIAIMFSMLLPVGISAQEQQPDPKLESEAAALTKTIDSYVTAFNARDMTTISNHWSPDGV